MEKQKLAFFGCGKLAHIVVDALNNGLLPDYEPVGAFSRSQEKVNKIVEKAGNCKGCHSLTELLETQPDYIVEAASPQGMKSLAIPALQKGISIISLSIGALADEDFLNEVKETAKANQAKVHLVSGAIGGFDVLRTATLMGNSKAFMQTEKGPHSLKDTSVYKNELEEKKEKVFSGTAKEAIALFPTKVNVAVAASLATVGPEEMNLSIVSTPEFVGDDHRIEVKNDQVHAVVDIYSSTSEIAGWSVVHTLQNIVSPIVFG